MTVAHRREAAARRAIGRLESFGLPAALMLALAVTSPSALAQSGGKAKRVEPAKQTQAEPVAASSAPLLAVVSLRDQRIAIYAGTTQVARAPVSTGRSGYETPAGVFSIIEKNKEHYSNLYDDAPMPFMQRITWSGVALHAGNLPGYPASHGCIRLPYSFAERLFGMTRMNTRVVVAWNDAVPLMIEHPKLLKRSPAEPETAAPVTETRPAEPARRTEGSEPPMMLGVRPPTLPRSTEPATQTPAGMSRAMLAAREAAKAAADKARAAEADRVVAAAAATEAGRVAQLTKAAVAARQAEAARAGNLVNAAQKARHAAGLRFAAATKAVENARTPEAAERAEKARAQAETKLAEAEAALENAQGVAAARAIEAGLALDTARAAEAARLEAMGKALEAARSASQARAAHALATRAAARRAEPVSVFVSRKAGKLYVRQGFEPLFESAVMIANPEQPMGTHVFTALAGKDGSLEMRWSVVTAETAPGLAAAERTAARSGRRGGRDDIRPVSFTRAPQTPASVLDRVEIPAETLAKISDMLIPGSSLIISDHGISTETGKGTDFVILTQ